MVLVRSRCVNCYGPTRHIQHAHPHNNMYMYMYSSTCLLLTTADVVYRTLPCVYVTVRTQCERSVSALAWPGEGWSAARARMAEEMAANIAIHAQCRSSYLPLTGPAPTASAFATNASATHTFKSEPRAFSTRYHLKRSTFGGGVRSFSALDGGDDVDPRSLIASTSLASRYLIRGRGIQG